MRKVTVVYVDRIRPDDVYDKVTGLSLGETKITIGQKEKTTTIMSDKVQKVIEEDNA